MSKRSGFCFCGWKSLAIELVKMVIALFSGIATLFIPLGLKDEGMVWYQLREGPNAGQWVMGQGATPDTTSHIVLLIGTCILVAIILWGLIDWPKEKATILPQDVPKK